MSRSFFGGGGGPPYDASANEFHMSSDTSSDPFTALDLAEAGSTTYYIPGGWTVDDGTVAEESYWGFDLTTRVLEVPDGAYVWQTQIFASVLLDATEYIAPDFDFAGDRAPAGGVFADGVGAAVFGVPVPNPTAGRQVWMRTGWILTKAPANRLVVHADAFLAGHPLATMASYNLFIAKVA